MDTSSITDYVTGHIPELILLVGGLMALAIVITYVKNESSKKYKFFMALGFIFGIAMIVLCISSYTEWPWFASVIIAVAGFTMVIRPFRNISFAAILAILVMVLAYLFLGELDGTVLEFMASGWPRIIAAFVLGAIAFMLTNFAESIIKLFGKLLNWWPLLLVLGLVCIAEAVMMLAGYGSLYDLFT